MMIGMATALELTATAAPPPSHHRELVVTIQYFYFVTADFDVILHCTYSYI